MIAIPRCAHGIFRSKKSGDGALFNMYRGALFSGIDVPMVLLLWPGYGVSRCGFHYGCMPPGSEAATHTHPVSDECIVNWIGSGLSLISGEYIATGPLDVVLAPCGVQHGGKIRPTRKAQRFPAALRHHRNLTSTCARRTTRKASIGSRLSKCSRQRKVTVFARK
jgi:hypothetical protein